MVEIQNVDQLRHHIDQGRTGDKVSHPDPSAAPLGTDAEAGGVSPSRAEVVLDAAASAHRRHRPQVPNLGPVICLAAIQALLGVIAVIGWITAP